MHDPRQGPPLLPCPVAFSLTSDCLSDITACPCRRRIPFNVRGKGPKMPLQATCNISSSLEAKRAVIPSNLQVWDPEAGGITSPRAEGLRTPCTSVGFGWKQNLPVQPWFQELCRQVCILLLYTWLWEAEHILAQIQEKGDGACQEGRAFQTNSISLLKEEHFKLFLPVT